MVTKISTDNLSTLGTSDLVTLSKPPTISSIRLTDINWNISGLPYIILGNQGYMEIVGSKFSQDCAVLIDNTPAQSVIFVNSGLLRVTIQSSLVAKTSAVYVVNGTSSVAIRPTGVTFA